MAKYRFSDLKKLFSPKRAGSAFLLGAFVLLVATYGVWQLQQLFLPNNDGSTTTTFIRLKSSDRSSVGNPASPLQNRLKQPANGGTATDSPAYGYNWTTELPTDLGTSSSNTLFRIQGEATFKKNVGGPANSFASLDIHLPPTGLLLPDKVYFGGTLCSFGGDSGTGPLPGCQKADQSYPTYQFTKTRHTSEKSDNKDDHYIITVANIPKDDGIAYHQPKILKGTLSQIVGNSITASAFAPPPATSLCAVVKVACGPGAQAYGFQVTFSTNTISVPKLNEYRSYLTNNGLESAYLGKNSNCELADANDPIATLCLKTALTLNTPDEDKKTLTNHLVQSVSFGQAAGGSILFEGNVGGGNSVNGFGFTDTKAIAVGGSIGNNVQGNAVPGYFQSGTKLVWGNVATPGTIANRLDTMFKKRAYGAVYSSPGFGGPTASQTWYLNSRGIPSTDASNSFSSPPEGKLWNATASSLTFGKGGVNFDGRGTIAVNGDVTFLGDVTCSNGQFAIIASGSIIFKGNVRCGAYTALGTTSAGDINFDSSVTLSTSWTGIFAAKNNINLPTLSPVTLIINYNTELANDPTVLFKELLGIIFSTDS